MVTTTFILVIARDFLSSTLVPLKFTHQIKPFISLIFFMCQPSQSTYCLFNNFVLVITFSLNFTNEIFVVKGRGYSHHSSQGSSENGLYSLRLPQLQFVSHVSFSTTRASSTTWHRHLGILITIFFSLCFLVFHFLIQIRLDCQVFVN